MTILERIKQISRHRGQRRGTTPAPGYGGTVSSFNGFMRWARSASFARTYLEIGVETGQTLMMGGTGTTLSVGVDPDYRIVAPADEPVRVSLFRKTSDAFFADRDWYKVSSKPVDLTLVDGLHLCEYALRDILNTERLSHRRSLILIHDIVPGSVVEASREQNHGLWMGDVFRVVPALQEFRPDLKLTLIGDCEPSGMLVIEDLDPTAKPINLDAAQTLMEAIDFERDFDRLLRPLLVSTTSPTFAALRRRVENRFSRVPFG